MSVGHQTVTKKNCIYWSGEKISHTNVVLVWWYLETHRDNSEFHFIRNVQLALFQNLAEMEEHSGITVHTFDEAKAITHGSYHTLHKKTSRETKPTLVKSKSLARKWQNSAVVPFHGSPWWNGRCQGGCQYLLLSPVCPDGQWIYWTGHGRPPAVSLWTWCPSPQIAALCQWN